MIYPLIEFPKLEWFASLTDEKVRAYFAYFMRIKTKRLTLLENVILASEDEEFQSWIPDKSPHSLHILGRWFSQNINLHRSSQTFLRKYQDTHSGYGREQEWVLSPKTLSFVVDVGMYLGDTLVTANTNLEWKMYQDTPQNVDHNQPVINGFGENDSSFHCNPITIIHVLALQLARGKYPHTQLVELYWTWVQNIEDAF